MKKVFSYMVAIVACVCMISCASKTELDKQCDEIGEAIKAENWDDVAAKCDALYQKKGEFTEANYINLAAFYNGLAAKAAEKKDAVSQYTYVQRVVELYEAAVAKDADVVKAVEKILGLDLANVVSQYKANMSQYEAAANAVQQQAAPEETEEASAEEGEEAAEGGEATEEAEGEGGEE